MKKNGFTLVELMAVIVLIAIIGSIGTASIMGVRKAINNDMWNSKIALIENNAERFGEDNKILLKNTCTFGGKTYSSCLTITVQTLLDRNYITSKDRDNNDKKVIINDTKKETETGYYANNLQVYVYLENDIVYAKLKY